jgi:hypothetical protein
MSRVSLLLFCLLGLAGCAKPDLANSVVRAGSEEELAAFRAELVANFGTGALAAYDVALNELQLAGMDRGLATAADRAAAMRAQVHGRTVHAVEILGWQARRARLLSEIRQLTEIRDHQIAVREKTAATGTPRAVHDRIASAEEVLTKLRRHLGETAQQLSAWGQPAS